MNYERRRTNGDGGNGDNGVTPPNGTQPENDAETDWKTQLLDVVKAMPPEAFERLAQRLLREAGFIKVEVTQRSGDGGIDGTGVLRVNLISFQVLFQCKRYAGSVGSGVIRDFRGAMAGRCDKGLIITTGTFTADAQKEASRDGATAIDLVDGDFLCDLIKKYGLGVHTRTVEQVVVDGSWFESI
ncbi:restriction system protein [Limimonas halophila]|uniref:Restriction system protein n=2 Tax=Limimonas halophila TaxID=1082479 RepID=A0A1G7PUB4_9PROT|nr:restriction system protein [Limimonas halophila]